MNEYSLANELVHGGWRVWVLTFLSVCFPAACTDKELRNLASRLKDWFGALHEDANRVIKPTSSDTAQGSKPTLFSLVRCQYPFSVIRHVGLAGERGLKQVPVLETLNY